MNNKMYRTSIMKVYPSETRIDARYQRKTRDNHVKHIIGDFNINKVNMPKVSLRADGKFYIMDGAHTVAAWKIKFGNEPITCIVYYDLTWEEEAEIFLAQRGITVAVTTKEKINTRYNMKDEEVVAMTLITDEFGVKLNFYNPNTHDYRINATDALYSVYKSIGRELFRDVLYTIVTAWDGDYHSFGSGFLKGMGKFYELYNGKFKKEDFIKNLKEFPPEHFMMESKTYLTGTIATKYCRSFLKVYNRGRKNKLPDIL